MSEKDEARRCRAYSEENGAYRFMGKMSIHDIHAAN